MSADGCHHGNSCRIAALDGRGLVEPAADPRNGIALSIKAIHLLGQANSAK